MGGIPDILWPILNVLRAEVGSAQANESNQALWNRGAGMLGMPLDKPLPGMSHSEWQNNQSGQSGIGSQLMGLLGDQTAYGNEALSGLMSSGVRGYSDLYGRTQDRNAGLQGAYGRLGAQMGDRGSSLERQLSQGYNQLGQGFAGREQDVMGLLRGMGSTERMDLNEALSNTAAGNQSALRSRGLGSSTIAGGQATADSRARSREMGALEERLRTQQAGTLAGLRGDTLGAQERGLGASAALGSSNLDRNTQIGMGGLGAMERGNTQLGSVQEAGLQNYLGNLGGLANFNLGQMNNQMGLTEQNTMRQLQWLQQLQHAGPSTDAAWSGLTNYAAASNAPQPQQPGFFQSMAPGIGAGVGTAGGAALLGGLGSWGGAAAGKMAMLICVDGSAAVTTSDGDVQLQNVAIGDFVLTPGGEFVKVVGMDVGQPWAERASDFVRIEKNGQSLVCTLDHIIDGLAAGDWPDAIGHDPVVCGDLKLEGATQYMANGFAVTSMFTVYPE